MFDSIKTNIKLVLLGGAVVLILIVLGVLYYQHKKIEVITSENSNLTTAVQTGDTTIKQDAQTAAVTDTVVTDSVNDTKAVDNQVKVVVQERDQKKADVVKKYDNLPKPVTQVDQAAQDKARSDELSRVQIQSIWQAYCIAAPADAKCTPGVITASAAVAQ